jgi:diguanylate cyclase (GGDEF)-like protein
MFTSSSPTNIRSVSFGLPIVLLLILLALLTAGLLTLATKGQNQVAREASITIARAAFNVERDSLEQIVRDYSWWNAAVKNLVFDFSPAWARENLEWLQTNFGVSQVFVFGPDRRPVYTTLGDGGAAALDDPVWRLPDFLDIVARAQSQSDTPEAATTAYVVFPEGIQLVAASKIIEEADRTGHPPYPEKAILVVTKHIDGKLINRIGHAFQLRGLTLNRDAPDPDAARLPLRDSTGEPVAFLHWQPSEPGTQLLEWLAWPLGLVFACVGGVIAMIVVRARRAGMALQEAFDARIAAQEELEYSARHDALTELPNRALFLEHLATSIAHALRYGSSFTLHYLDLDGFKGVNDTYGHPAGDEMLTTLAERFRSVVRATDTIARFGGDEFAILQRTTSDPQDARLLAQRLIDAVEAPFDIEGREVRITLSVGIAFDIESEDPEEIISKADRALYRAKREGGNRFEIYDPSLDERGARGLNETDSPPHACKDRAQEVGS